MINRLRRYLFMIAVFFHGDGYRRADFLEKKNYFGHLGKHCYLQPLNFGTEPHLIYFGNNVHVATGVTFINHDIVGWMFQYMHPGEKFTERAGIIKIGNNVFIGANATLLYDITIGNNVIIAAGSLINKDVPSGVIIGGIPARVIGSFGEYLIKSKEYALTVPWSLSDSKNNKTKKQKQYYRNSMQKDKNC